MADSVIYVLYKNWDIHANKFVSKVLFYWFFTPSLRNFNGVINDNLVWLQWQLHTGTSADNNTYTIDFGKLIFYLNWNILTVWWPVA